MEKEGQRVCCPGYYLKDTQCISFCKDPCPPNSQCQETGQCVCQSGYAMDNATKSCVATCSTTTGPDSKCLTTTTPNEVNNCTTTGYKFNLVSNKCQPVCRNKCAELKGQDMSSGCQHICLKKCRRTGQCFTAGHAEQQIIFPNNISVSEHLCTQNCGFGECSEPGALCQCLEGFILNNHTLLCEPICSVRCPQHSHCVLPNVCACDKGYRLDPTTKHRCKPLDSKVFASYVGSLSNSHKQLLKSKLEQVLHSCGTGYRFNETLRRCQPICHNDCLNGNCTSPDVCVCSRGYSMEFMTHSCQPNPCKVPCLHGYCIPDGDCVCPEGFTKSLNRGSGCEPVFLYNLKVVPIFICVIVIVSVIIWLIIVAERRRRRHM